MSVSETALSVTPVQSALDQLQAQRDVEWTAEQLSAQRSVRLGLEQDADSSRFVKVGDVVGPVALAEVDGGLLRVEELLERGPVVLIFFRYEGCPACNVALPAYRDALWPELQARGVQLIAVSPQAPALLAPIKTRLGADFFVASDQSGLLIRSFGIAFGPRAEGAELVAQRERVASLLGTGRSEFPYPTVVLIDREGVVRFVDVHPNWMVRTEVTAVLDAVDAIA